VKTAQVLGSVALVLLGLIVGQVWDLWHLNTDLYKEGWDDGEKWCEAIQHYPCDSSGIYFKGWWACYDEITADSVVTEYRNANEGLRRVLDFTLQHAGLRDTNECTRITYRWGLIDGDTTIWSEDGWWWKVEPPK